MKARKSLLQLVPEMSAPAVAADPAPAVPDDPAPAAAADARRWGAELGSSRSEPEPWCPSRLAREVPVWVRRERDRELPLSEYNEDLERRLELVA